MSTARRRVAAALGAVLTVTAAASACGIRATSVPVDAGAAPSRVSCTAPSASASAGTSADSVRLYLVCRGAQVSPVWRAASAASAAPITGRLATADRLLAELQREPGPDESSAGFATAVPDDLKLIAARRTDPADALRLSIPLDELPPFALAQLVCTFAGTAAGSTDGTVVLGGLGSAAPHRYGCTEDLRANATRTAGTAV
ncbi:hypothetical protein ACFXJ5_01525 [Streptomyces sp. NPDC059373]